MVNSLHSISEIKAIDKQKGVVLVVSLVFLIALTAVAAALMQNTTTDMKMSGASEEKVFAIQCAVSAVDDYTFQQVNKEAGEVNDFAEDVNTYKAGDKEIVTQHTTTKEKCDLKASSMDLANNPYHLTVPCPRTKAASSVGTISCNMLRVQTSINYGRNKTSEVEVNANIVQPIL